MYRVHTMIKHKLLSDPSMSSLLLAHSLRHSSFLPFHSSLSLSLSLFLLLLLTLPPSLTPSLSPSLSLPLILLPLLPLPIPPSYLHYTLSKYSPVTSSSSSTPLYFDMEILIFLSNDSIVSPS